LRLLLDEMHTPAVAEQLRARGHDVVSVHDPAYRRLEGATDEEILAAALEEERALVTDDVRDFRQLEAAALARGERVPGLVFTTNRRFPRSEPATIGRLVLTLAALLDGPEPPATTFLRPASSEQ
jgi:predicted nuclease of predicted toxin-antitoxin system